MTFAPRLLPGPPLRFLHDPPPPTMPFALHSSAHVVSDPLPPPPPKRPSFDVAAPPLVAAPPPPAPVTVPGHDGPILGRGGVGQSELRSKGFDLTQCDTFGPIEKAVKIEYDLNKKDWVASTVRVQVAVVPFDRGVTRYVHKLRIHRKDGLEMRVAKFLDPDSLRDLVGPITREMYFDDAMVHTTSRNYAAAFNARDPPKKIHFVESYVLELCERPGKPLCCVEPLLDGDFTKHNNNNGGVLSQRETPQAFSHFTYEASNFELLVCDIQGVGDVFTDPQIHTRDGSGFGLGNQGTPGMFKFLQSHTCNGVCQGMGLAVFVNGVIVQPGKGIPSVADDAAMMIESDTIVLRKQSGPSQPTVPPVPRPPASLMPATGGLAALEQATRRAKDRLKDTLASSRQLRRSHSGRSEEPSPPAPPRWEDSWGNKAQEENWPQGSATAWEQQQQQQMQQQQQQMQQKQMQQQQQQHHIGHTMDEVMAPIQTPLSLGASVTIDPVHVAGMRDSPPGGPAAAAAPAPAPAWGQAPLPPPPVPANFGRPSAGPGHVASAEAMSAAATGVPMGVGFAYGVIPADSQSELGMQTSAVRETISSGVAPVPLTKTSSNKQPVIYMEC